MKIVQNVLFRSCGARFGQIAFASVKVLKIVTLASNSLQNGETVPFLWKLYKQNAIFQVMRSTFWPNRICERLSSVIRHTGLKLSPKRENSALSMKIIQKAPFRSWAASFGQIAFLSVKVLKIGNLPQILFKRENGALSMKIVQNALFRSCAARFGQIAFLKVKLLKIVTLVSNSRQNGKPVRIPWKLYKTLFSGHGQHVLAKSHFWPAKFSESSHSPEICFKTGKQRAFHESCTKRSFQIMRSTFWPNRIFESQSSQNSDTGLKFYSKPENSALSMKVVQNALVRWCAARFGQIAFLSIKDVKIVTLALNSLQKGKTVRFSWKLYKTLFSGHAEHVLAKSHLWAAKFSKSSHWP